MGSWLMGAVVVEYCCIALASLVVGMWFRTMITCTLDDDEELAIALARTGSM